MPGQRAVSLVLVAGVVMTSCSDGGEPSDAGGVADSSAPAATEVFDPETDDLCEWVTGDEIVAFLNDAGDDVEAPATPSQPAADDATGWDCAWGLASGEEIQLGARSTSPRTQTEPDDPEASGAGFVEYEEPGQIMEPGAYVIGHPDLGDEITVENEAFLRFSFYPLSSDHILNVNYLSDDAMCDESELDDSRYCEKDTSGYETVLMRTANALLGQLRWLAA